jgi:tetratricopeptide (TPR) repeat protein
VYNQIGLIYADKGELDAALEQHMKRLEISEQLGDRPRLAASYNNIAWIHRAKGEIKAARECWERALVLPQETQLAEGLFNVGWTFGNFLCELRERERGVALLREAIVAGRRMGHPELPAVEDDLRW